VKEPCQHNSMEDQDVRPLCPYCDGEPKEVRAGKDRAIMCSNHECWTKPATPWCRSSRLAWKAWNNRYGRKGGKP
jgi:hypothetical protein